MSLAVADRAHGSTTRQHRNFAPHEPRAVSLLPMPASPTAAAEKVTRPTQVRRNPCPLEEPNRVDGIRSVCGRPVMFGMLDIFAVVPQGDVHGHSAATTSDSRRGTGTHDLDSRR